MGLETGTGIGDLVPANPLSTDAVSVGDDHIRLIKTVMQSITFLKSIQTFTASGTWTRPTNVRRIIVVCLGGGGGGGGGAVAGYAGGGGSSGATAIKWVDVTALASATVTIGAGGTAGAAAEGLGGNGGATIFGSACTAAGGQAGTGAALFPGPPQARAASTGDIVFAGESGQYGNYVPGVAATAFGGQGGGNGGPGGGFVSGAAEPNSGGGGGGGNCTPAASSPAGAGGTGYCIVFEFGW